MKKIVGLALVLVLSLSLVTASALVLKQGSTGAEVSNLQTKLRDLGYYKGSIDGTYGPSTWEAVWWFQKNNKLKVDGIAGSQTLSALGLHAGTQIKGLSYGTSGESVKSMQAALQKLGYYKGTVDGKYKDSTWRAIWWFQKDNNLSADGIAGSHTLTALYSKAGYGSYSGAPIQKMKYGTSSASVRTLQTALKNLGYYTGAVDGSYGDATWKAVWTFQRDNKIATDGLAGPEVFALLKLQPSGATTPSAPVSTVSQLPGGKTLKIGSSDDSVWRVQYALKNAGYYKGSVDGRYGDATWTAVWQFQRDNGLSPDGNVGQSTWGILIK